MGSRYMPQDARTLPLAMNNKKERRQKRVKRRRNGNDSTISETDSSENFSQNEGHPLSDDDGDRQLIRSDLIEVLHDADLKEEDVIDTVSDGRLGIDSLTEGHPIPDDDDDRQSIWSDLMELAFDFEIQREDVTEKVNEEKNESSSPMPPEDAEVVSAVQDSNSPLPYTEEFEIVWQIEGDDPPHIDSNTSKKNESPKANEMQRNPKYDDENELSTGPDSAVFFPTTEQGQEEDVFELGEEDLALFVLYEDIDIEIDAPEDPDSVSEGSHFAPNIEDFEILEELPPPDVENEDSKMQRNKPKHTCNICSKTFPKKSKLKRHLRVHSGDRPFSCLHPGCGQKFTVKNNLTRHLRIHNGERTFKCNFPGCSRAFNQPDNLKRHEKLHERPFRCDFQGCDKVFTEAKHLKKHKKTHGNDAQSQEENVDEDEVESDTGNRQAERPFPCPHPGCDKAFKRRNHMTRHLLIHDSTSAKDCSRKRNNSGNLAGKEDLKQHLRVHINTAKGQRPFLCPHPGCEMAFQRKDNMTRHFLLHNVTGIRPFKCNFPGCSQAFEQAAYLRCHEKIHARRFRCDFEGCLRTFKDSGGLKAHKKLHGRPRTFQCDFPECSKSFTTADHLKRHEKTHAKNTRTPNGK